MCSNSELETQDGVIYAPHGFFSLVEPEFSEICNGAGSRGLGFVVPDDFYGVSITDCANVHDYMYHFEFDRKFSDETFYSNMKRVIKDATKDKSFLFKSLNRLRYTRAYFYFKAVRLLGGIFYNNGN